LGQVYQTRLNDLDRAIAAYRDVINAAPEHQDTVRALEALFESQNTSPNNNGTSIPATFLRVTVEP